MIFVYGEGDKSSKVLEFIQEKQVNSVLIVNMCEKLSLWFSGCDIVEFKNQNDMWEQFLDDEFFAEFIVKARKYDLVVFLMNEIEDWLDNYTTLESMIGKEIIVTARNLGEIEVVDYQ